MEVASPVHSPDFNFSSSVYANAPSTPKLMGADYYFSAPTSPARVAELNLDFDDLLIADATHRSYSLAAVPFAWEEKPGVPKAFTDHLFDENFAFHVSGHQLSRNSSAAAEDLFDAGVIKSMEIEPQPPSAAAMQLDNNLDRERGRERNSSRLPSSRSRRTRSLPPFRGLEQPPVPVNTTTPTSSTCTTLAACGSGKGSKKWSFMDLFLFRSASDGRAMDRDPLKKYSATFRKHDEDFRNSTFRPDRSGSGSGSKRRGRVSAHELHYNVNRAVSKDMKKQTFLPYKQGILGRLAFNPTVNALANGFGFSHNN